MRIPLRYVFPAMLMLVGCATANNGAYHVSDASQAPGAAPPQRVEAVSDALGARMNSMLANTGGVTQ